MCPVTDQRTVPVTEAVVEVAAVAEACGDMDLMVVLIMDLMVVLTDHTVQACGDLLMEVLACAACSRTS